MVLFGVRIFHCVPHFGAAVSYSCFRRFIIQTSLCLQCGICPSSSWATQCSTWLKDIFKKKSKNAAFYVLVQVKFRSQLAVSENYVRNAAQPLWLRPVKTTLMVQTSSVQTPAILVVCREVFQLKEVQKLGSHSDPVVSGWSCQCAEKGQENIVLLAGLVSSGTCTTVNANPSVELCRKQQRGIRLALSLLLQTACPSPTDVCKDSRAVRCFQSNHRGVYIYACVYIYINRINKMIPVYLWIYFYHHSNYKRNNFSKKTVQTAGCNIANLEVTSARLL